MNRRLTEEFYGNPVSLDIQRSKFTMNHSYITTANFGDIIPFECREVLPGDTFGYNTNLVARLQSLITPVMSNMFLDVYYFFVPHRLVWDHWKELNGENNTSAWVQPNAYTVPQIDAPSGGWNVGTIADYFGIPTGVTGFSVNAMPIRSYALICDQWFRDENLSQPLYIPTGDTTVTGSNGSTYVNDVAKGGAPYKASKLHDYFTSALPGPIKSFGDVPIFPANVQTLAPVFPVAGARHDLSSLAGKNLTWTMTGTSAGSTPQRIETVLGSSSDLNVGIDGGTGTLTGLVTTNQFNPSYNSIPDNLWANLQGVGSIGALRTAFQMQKLLEKDARSGSRYIETIKAHFGVTSPDGRLQRSEYLGGTRIPINVNQVIQTSETATTPQGNPAAYSLTADHSYSFQKSFTEHGLIIGVFVARYPHVYSQGLNKMWSRRDRFDYYWPVLANISERPILKKEIYLSGNTVTDNSVFGYQEAWAEYRMAPSIVTGEMRSSASNSLDVWHLADDYASAPSLSSSWIMEDKSNVDRVLAVQSSVSNQILVDIYMEVDATRPMPLFSIPGLVDHH